MGDAGEISGRMSLNRGRQKHPKNDVPVCRKGADRRKCSKACGAHAHGRFRSVKVIFPHEIPLTNWRVTSLRFIIYAKQKGMQQLTCKYRAKLDASLHSNVSLGRRADLVACASLSKWSKLYPPDGSRRTDTPFFMLYPPRNRLTAAAAELASVTFASVALQD